MDLSSLLDLRKFVAPEFVFGQGAISMAGRYVNNLGARKAMLVSDAGVLAAGWVDLVCHSLDEYGVDYVMHLDVSPNPRDTEVMACAAAYREAGCEALVAVGGGSSLDLAKGAGIAMANNRNILAFEGVDNVPAPGPPLLCIPTTAGSSADVSQFAIITDHERHVKIAVVSKTMVPDIALIDPEVTTTMSAALTSSTGLDALTHAMEAYASNASSPITDLLSLEAVRLIARNLPLAMERPRDLRVRGAMMLGSLYAGLAFSNAILGAVHAMAHSLGGRMDLPHGVCNAVLLDHVVRFNYPAAPDRYDRIAEALGVEDIHERPRDERLDALTAGIRQLKRKVGVTQSLADLGVTRADLRSLAQHAAQDPCLATNPIIPTVDELEAVYAQAL